MKTFLFLLKALIYYMLIAILPFSSFAQHSAPVSETPFYIQRIKSPVRLDGLSNEPAWEGLKSLPLVMRTPDFGDEPSMHTEILLGYDDDYIYAAGRFYDREPSKIKATSFKRDGGWNWNTDQMGLIFDTFNDNENGVIFVTTPSGTRSDINILNDGVGSFNRSWNTFWDVATVLNDDGWFAEMRIPFSSLRFEEKDGRVVMGLTAYRYIARKFEIITFPLIPEKFGSFGTFKPSQTHEVLFEGIKNHNPLYITPYLLGGSEQTSKLNNEGTAYKKENEFSFEGGLDVKYGLSKNLTLDLTINPDFAQVEADDQMINLTRYSLFFPEKRLFFQERQGNFEFGFEGRNRLFYSRRIGIHKGEQVRIYGGARIVGRAGPWDIGFLNMQTEKYEDLLSENFNVLRLRRQVLNLYSYIGGMLTSRIGNKDSWNTAYGVDGIFRLFGDDYLSLKWAQCFEKEKENKIASFIPSKIYVKWNRRKDKGFNYNLSYSRSGEDFRPGIGYERRNNYSRLGGEMGYGWYPGKTSRLQNHGVFIGGLSYIRNDDKKLESSQMNIGWDFTTKANSVGSITFSQFKEDILKSFSFSDAAAVPTGKYTFYGLGLSYSPLRGNPYRIGTTIEAGSFYDGGRISVSLNSVANISAHLQLSGMYQLNRIEFPDRDQQFTGHIARLKISAFLNSKLSLVSLAQYNSVIDKIITNFRLRYNPSEGHDLYIVYDEGLNTYRHREIPELPRSSDRTIMLKYSYTFKFGI